MKINQIKGIVHDLLYLENWKNPMEGWSLKNKFEIDLLKKEIIRIDIKIENDIFWEIYSNKINWFQNRIKELNGDLNDFQEAKIYVENNTERVDIVFKNKHFSENMLFGEDYEKTEKLRRTLKTLKPDMDLSKSDGRIS